MYEINDKAKTCQKKPLKAGFQPLKIPDEAQFIGQFVLGSSSGPGEGLLINSWAGDIPKGGEAFERKEKRIMRRNLHHCFMYKTDFT